MNADHSKPGVLTSRSELEVSDPATRAEVLNALQEILEGFGAGHPMFEGGHAVEADFDDTTIVLELRIGGRSFVQADTITQNVIESLVELINRPSSTGRHKKRPGVQQMSQTLVPA